MIKLIIFLNLLIFSARNIPSPFFKHGLHIIRYIRLEHYFLTGGGVDESERTSVKGLPGQYFETVLDKLPVFGKCCATKNLVSPVFRIVK